VKVCKKNYFELLVEFLFFLLGIFPKQLIDCLILIVVAYVLSYYGGHWFVSDALNYAISIKLKMRGNLVEISSTLDNLMDDGFRVALELSLFASNIRKGVCGVLDYFF
jgi:hypothetical protein